MSEAQHKILHNVDDFFWHKRSLELASRSANLRHNGVPERYPCIVTSDVWDDPNGPMQCDHSFQYRVYTVCGHCGQKTQKWPHEIPVAEES